MSARPSETPAPNIAVEVLRINPSSADAEWVMTWPMEWPSSFNTLRDAISAALRTANETGSIHRVLHDGDVVWASDGVK